MNERLQITFRNMPSSAAVEESVHDHAAKLDHVHHRIIKCRVVIETPHRHQHQGRLHEVHIDIVIPGREIVIGRTPQAHHAHEDVYVAIRDAFAAARRQLEDHVRQERDAYRSRASMEGVDIETP